MPDVLRNSWNRERLRNQEKPLARWMDTGGSECVAVCAGVVVGVFEEGI